jgi:D-alanyl-lipoteichoic acid acyltransferase DltB (MBOAT superfamily)
MSQFVGRKAWSLDPQDASVGLTIFFFGLFKKVVLAEGVAGFIGPVFDLPQGPPGFLESWGAALAYTFQLYFDFSGYSDMAIGAARLFGIRLPANFHSPYKAIGIADFWQRWHMTLTRFLRYYVFLPMVWRSPIGGWWWLSSVMLTFLVSGLWHGVGWNFVVWGLLHGFYLLVEFGWRALRHRFGLDQAAPDAWSRWAGRILTFLAVVVGWVFFRSSTVGGAWRILEGMAGLNGAGVLSSEAPSGLLEAAWLAGLLTVAWFFPNTQQVMAGFRPALNLHKETPGGLESRLRWSPSWAWLAIVLIIAVAASTNLGEATAKFLYARF